MAITFELPQNIEKALREEFGNLDQAAKEALLLDAYRHGRLTHFDLGEALGLDRHETNAFLKQHDVYEGSLTAEDLELQKKLADRALTSEHQ